MFCDFKRENCKTETFSIVVLGFIHLKHLWFVSYSMSLLKIIMKHILLWIMKDLSPSLLSACLWLRHWNPDRRSSQHWAVCRLWEVVCEASHLGKIMDMLIIDIFLSLLAMHVTRREVYVVILCNMETCKCLNWLYCGDESIITQNSKVVSMKEQILIECIC